MLAQTNEYASDLHNIGIVHHPEHVCSKSDDSGAGVSFEPPLKSMHSYVLAQHTSLAWESRFISLTKKNGAYHLKALL